MKKIGIISIMIFFVTFPSVTNATDKKKDKDLRYTDDLNRDIELWKDYRGPEFIWDA